MASEVLLETFEGSEIGLVARGGLRRWSDGVGSGLVGVIGGGVATGRVAVGEAVADSNTLGAAKNEKDGKEKAK